MNAGLRQALSKNQCDGARAAQDKKRKAAAAKAKQDKS